MWVVGGGGYRGQRPRLALVQMLAGALQELVNIIVKDEKKLPGN